METPWIWSGHMAAWIQSNEKRVEISNGLPDDMSNEYLNKNITFRYSWHTLLYSSNYNAKSKVGQLNEKNQQMQLVYRDTSTHNYSLHIAQLQDGG